MLEPSARLGKATTAARVSTAATARLDVKRIRRCPNISTLWKWKRGQRLLPAEAGCKEEAFLSAPALGYGLEGGRLRPGGRLWPRGFERTSKPPPSPSIASPVGPAA